jgi:hypothetical protein
MSYETHEVIRCDGPSCGRRFGKTAILHFGRPTPAQWELLSRTAIEEGWSHVPCRTAPDGRTVEYTKHYCPDCSPVEVAKAVTNLRTKAKKQSTLPGPGRDG